MVSLLNNWFAVTQKTTPGRQCQVGDWQEWHLIHQPDVNLVFMPRAVTEGIRSFSERLIQIDFPGIDHVVSVGTVDAVLDVQLSRVAGDSAIAKEFAHDLATITRAFIQITGRAKVKLILKVVSDDACERFHTDRYDLRLLCTYYGPGTEWTPDDNVNRKKLMGGTNDEIIRDWSRINRLQQFDVAILKGEASTTNYGKGIVHRSPPVSAQKEKRLLLRLDA
ncbi:MAG: DUF1826 domain-containing protein [Cyclobacteriaceae bacterium]|nr:DUF1826 domain-containing protein [Cyclobacteriaceae bacterium]